MNSTTSLQILLADDDLDDCLFFKQALEELALDVTITNVYDGEQLMQLLTQDGGVNNFAPLPYILFLDLNMPRKNGFECLNEIKKNSLLKNLPVIVFSTSYDEEIANQLYKNGAQFYICKPSEFNELKKVIHKAMLLVRQNLTSTKENFILNKSNIHF